MEKKKLIINAAVCDARNVSETTLESYSDININAGTILVSQETKDLMAKYNVTMNTAEVTEVSAEAEIMIQNGSYEISDGTLLSKPAVLIVNGSLNIETRSQEVLDKFMLIQVNGSVSYPSDIKDKLPIIKVNGSIDSYPGDAIKLKSKLIMDKTFILRAKGQKYYVKNKVIIPDKDLNIVSLKEAGTIFITKKAITAESLLEDAVALFDEHVEIKIIPDGLIYTNSEILNDVLIRKHGDKLYVDGDLTINLESENALEKLTRLKVEGTVFIYENFIEKFHNISPEYNDIQEVKGASIGDKAFLTIDKRKLNKYKEGVRVFDCGIVNVKDDIDT
ncbi:MAG: hypothetical protein GX053_12060, partial [Tissierella sp.]|nr:hypothetical protein [Tissierella sp.]